MWQQIKQVGMTYVTRRWPMVGLLIGVPFLVGPKIVLALTRDRAPQEHEPMAILVVGMVVGAVGLWLGTMAKWQFAHPRARLTPGFAGPHLGTFAMLMIAGVGGFPLLFAWVSHFDILGLTTLAAVLACCQIWSFHRNSALISLLVMVLWFGSINSPGIRYWSGGEMQQTLVHAGLLTAAWGGLLYWLWRLPQLHEEMPEYQPLVLEVATGSSRQLRSQQGRLQAEQITRVPLLAYFTDRWHDRIDDYPRSPRRRVAWLLRYGFGGMPISLRAAGLVAMTLLVCLSYIASNLIQPHNPSPMMDRIVVWVQVLLACCMPTFFIMGAMANRRPQLGGELLRPLSRVQLIEGLFGALAMDLAMLWFSNHMAIMGIVYIVFPNLFEPQIVAMVLVLSIALQPVLFFFTLAIYTRLGFLRMAIGCACVIMVVVATFSFWWITRTDWGDGVFVLGALLMALSGVAMLARVRRQWLNLEFG